MKQKDLVFFTVCFFVLAVGWILFTILHSAVSSTISEAVQANIEPITPSFDTSVITALKNREKITQLANPSPVLSPSITPLIQPTTTASQGGKLQ